MVAADVLRTPLNSAVRRTYRVSIESDIVERVNRAASKKQIPISDTKQNDQNRF
jgi:hypothetical protein